MFPLTFADLLGTPAPTAQIAGVLAIALFAVMGVMVGPDYDGMNATAKDNINNSKN